jgi:hypothetical protein
VKREVLRPPSHSIGNIIAALKHSSSPMDPGRWAID